MNAARLAILANLALAFCLLAKTQAAEKPADLIIGKWVGVGGKVQVPSTGEEYDVEMFLEFSKDGTVKATAKDPKLKGDGTTQSGRYRWLGDTEIELVMKREKDEEVKVKAKVMVTKEELTLHFPGEDKPQKLKRTK